MEGIINLHHDLMFFITFILFFVMILMGRTLFYFNVNGSAPGAAQNVVHGTVLEIV
jgi:heme/copper-type cytochrome/quinol oxidase subunit 2